MNTAGVEDAIEQLGGHLSELDQTLQPLLTSALSDTTKKLPLLDRAKLYVTIVYTIESLIFSYLRLQGVNAKEHKIFTELQRVRQYFTKLAEAEESSTPSKRENLSLNKQAAGRMIKQALASNKRLDADLAARKEEELAKARQQLQQMEERLKKRRSDEQQAKEDGRAHAQESEMTAQSEAEVSKVANAIAQIRDEVNGSEAGLADTEPQTPDSAAYSDHTESSKTSKTSKKSKKKRRLEQAMESSSAKKKRKQFLSDAIST